MEKRIEAVFTFQGRAYIAYLLIKDNEEGYTYIVNLFDKELNKAFPHSYTFTAKDSKFLLEKPMESEKLELINALKEAIRNHPENTYRFTD